MCVCVNAEKCVSARVLFVCVCVCVSADADSNAHFCWHFGCACAHARPPARLPVRKKQRVEKVWKDWKLSVKLVRRKAKSATFGLQHVTFSPHFNHLYYSQVAPSTREESASAKVEEEEGG